MKTINTQQKKPGTDWRLPLAVTLFALAENFPKSAEAGRAKPTQATEMLLKAKMNFKIFSGRAISPEKNICVFASLVAFDACVCDENNSPQCNAEFEIGFADPWLFTSKDQNSLAEAAEYLRLGVTLEHRMHVYKTDAVSSTATKKDVRVLLSISKIQNLTNDSNEAALATFWLKSKLAPVLWRLETYRGSRGSECEPVEAFPSLTGLQDELFPTNNATTWQATFDSLTEEKLAEMRFYKTQANCEAALNKLKKQTPRN